MTQFASDSFNGTENAELSAYNSSWAKVSGFTGNIEICSGRVRPSSTTTAVYYHSGTPASADYFVSADCTKVNITNDILVSIIGRASTSAGTHYRANLNPAGNPTQSQAQLYKFVNNAATQLGSTVLVGHATGETKNLKLEMVGTAIKLYFDGSSTPTISATDSGITSAGYAGLRTYSATTPADNNGVQVDNFVAEDIGVASAPTLSDLRAINVTSSSAQWSIDYTF